MGWGMATQAHSREVVAVRLPHFHYRHIPPYVQHDSHHIFSLSVEGGKGLFCEFDDMGEIITPLWGVLLCIGVRQHLIELGVMW